MARRCSQLSKRGFNSGVHNDTAVEWNKRMFNKLYANKANIHTLFVPTQLLSVCSQKMPIRPNCDRKESKGGAIFCYTYHMYLSLCIKAEVFKLRKWFEAQMPKCVSVRSEHAEMMCMFSNSDRARVGPIFSLLYCTWNMQNVYLFFFSFYKTINRLK